MQFFSFLTGARPALVDKGLVTLQMMLDVGAEMFAAATANLLDNESLSVNLGAMDEKINQGEKTIRRNVLQHVTVNPTDELSLSLLLISIVQDAERIGDLAKSIAKATALADSPRMGPHVEALRPIRDRIQDTFPKVREAFTAGDTEVARVVMEEHDENKKLVAGYLARLSTATDLTVNQAVVLSVGSRMIGRTGSHLSNIISAVAMPFDEIRRSPSWGDDE